MARKATKRKSAKTKAIRKAPKKATKKAARKTIKKEKKAFARKATKRKSPAKRRVKKQSTYDSAISTLTYYIEQGGKNLSDAGKATLEAAREVIHGVSTKISKSTA
jgi:hypothetical protein